jgi:hypothetical protein
MTDALDPQTRRAIVREIAALTRDKYVYPAVGAETAAELEVWLEEGRYDEISDANELALALTSDLRRLSNDNHWAVVYNPAGAAEHVDPESEADEARLARYLRMARQTNYGFERVECLGGNMPARRPSPPWILSPTAMPSSLTCGGTTAGIPAWCN